MKKNYIRQFRETLRIFDRELYRQNHASCCNGISMAQCHTLLELEKHQGIPVSKLAEKLSLDKSTVSRTVEGLVNMQMVKRVTPKENRRLALIHLTPAGKEVCSAINFSNDAYVDQVLKDFTEAERRDFLSLFRKLTGNMVARRQKEKKLP